MSGSSNVDISNIAPCNHEEADTRIILHCFHAARCGMSRIAVRTVDTDVVVLTVSYKMWAESSIQWTAL